MNQSDIINAAYREGVSLWKEEVLSDPDAWYQAIESLPVHLRVTYTVVILHRQVFNGGFYQYFGNQYGMFSFLTLHSLKEIGAVEHVHYLDAALEIVNVDHLVGTAFRHGVYYETIPTLVGFNEEVADRLHILDHKMYDSKQDLLGLLADYLRDRD